MTEPLTQIITLLFVDDETSILSTLKRVLRNEDYRVLTANSGQQGLEVLQQEKVDIVISDMLMPKMSGVQFLQQVKQNYPSSKRLIMSGYADTEAVVDAVNKAGICRFIAKPWDNNELKTIINDIIHSDLNGNLEEIKALQIIISEQQDDINGLKEIVSNKSKY